MAEWVIRAVESLGYLGVAGLMFLENVFPPIPSEVIMPLAGFASRRGTLWFWGVVVAGTVGSVLGQLPLYYLGYYFKRERLRKLADKHGRWLTVDAGSIDKSAAWFDRHGGGAVLLCRFVPGVRSFISIPAGMARMNLGAFLLYSTIGMGVWTLALAAAGYALGSQWDRVSDYLGPVSTAVVVGVAVLAIGWYAYRVVTRRKARTHAPSDSPPTHP